MGTRTQGALSFLEPTVGDGLLTTSYILYPHKRICVEMGAFEGL